MDKEIPNRLPPPMNSSTHTKCSGSATVTSNGSGAPAKQEAVDPGLRSLDHYKRALPKWRYDMRQQALPLIRWETPYLAWMQDKLRTPALDSYFAITANLGTHTFFMIGLPILFWCGHPSFGKALVHILALGVFWSGFIKDFYSLPRPLSPPLTRITMSGSVSLEYGFPSTHSANALSVAVYALLCLRSPENAMDSSTKMTLEGLAWFYSVSIVFGRLYCGMHGFTDVIIGAILGAIISVLEFQWGPSIEQYLVESNWTGITYVILAIIVLIRIHPEPADDCPCFDDSVSFAGVVMGVEIGTWHLQHTSYASIPFDPEILGWYAIAARIVFGVLCIFAWREVAKPSLLKGLPYVFRLIERLGLSLPRRFFLPASEYKNIPASLRVDNVIPTVSDVTGFVSSIRHPTRGRSISVGPQSAADAYEALAYRERRRRESVGSNASLRSKQSIQEMRGEDEHQPTPLAGGRSSAVSGQGRKILSDYERQMGEGASLVESSKVVVTTEPEMMDNKEDELEEKEVFSKLVKPRVRYDVEVVAKLVVYAGIGLIAVEGVPILFELIPGLGVGHF